MALLCVSCGRRLVWLKQEGVNKVPIDVPHPVFGSRPIHTEAGLTLHAFLGHACTLSTGSKPGSKEL